MQKVTSIFIILFAFYLCARDLVALASWEAEIVCNIDLSEDDPAKKKENDNKSKIDKWETAHLQQSFSTYDIFNFSGFCYTVRKYLTPFLEINSPPPQGV